jgi:4'-phosphopantetheinyl transferase
MRMLIDGPIVVVVTRLAVGPVAVRAAARLLSDAERHRASLFTCDRLRRRFIVARGRLRQLLAARLGVRPESIELDYGARGKPALAARFADSDLRFNVSHCDDVAVYALASGRAVGIDVEAIRVIRGADDISARFFSRREQAAYRALDVRDRPLGFVNCWTRKEAFIKALGDGLHYALDRFDVSLAPGEPAKILRVENTRGDRCGWQLASFSPAPGFVAAVVTETPHSTYSRCQVEKQSSAHRIRSPFWRPVTCSSSKVCVVAGSK